MVIETIDGINYDFKGSKKITVGAGNKGDGYDNNDIRSVYNIPSLLYYKGRKYIVTRIASFAFTGMNQTINVTIPNTVEVIDSCAFWQCFGLISVTFEPGSKLKSFTHKIFDCTKLTKLEIPESVINFADT